MEVTVKKVLLGKGTFDKKSLQTVRPKSFLLIHFKHETPILSISVEIKIRKLPSYDILS